MTSNNRDKDYLAKLDDVDEHVRNRIDGQFGQLRVIAIVGGVLALLLVVGRWLSGS